MTPPVSMSRPAAHMQHVLCGRPPKTDCTHVDQKKREASPPFLSSSFSSVLTRLRYLIFPLCDPAGLRSLHLYPSHTCYNWTLFFLAGSVLCRPRPSKMGPIPDERIALKDFVMVRITGTKATLSNLTTSSSSLPSAATSPPSPVLLSSSRLSHSSRSPPTGPSSLPLSSLQPSNPTRRNERS